MADVIDYKIIGSDMQLVEITLDPGEGVRAEVGAMTYMDQGIAMDTGTGGGLLKGFKRMMAGESFFITTYYNQSQQRQVVAFSASYPGGVLPIDLAQLGGTFICQKNAFLCAAQGVEIEVVFTKRFGAGLFGGEGFILQRLTGDGLAFVHAGGTLIQRQLMDGESLMVDTGCLVGFTPTVQYDIQMMKGVKNILLGGEGLFLAKLTGPGHVWLQSMPFSRLADRIMSLTNKKQ